MEKDFVFSIFLLPFFSLFLWVLLKKRNSILYVLPSILFLFFWIVQLVTIQKTEVWQLASWMYAGNSFSINLAFNLSSRVLFLVCLSALIALIIQIYSFAYLSEKENFGLYNTLISMFSAAMAWLFLAGNLFTLLVGWELVGVFSYLLIQFWYVDGKIIHAGLRVLLINKLGDIALIAGLGLLVSYGFGPVLFRESSFPEGSSVFFQSQAGSVVCLFLVVSAFVKSAQFPFNIWLKDAMSGPTSVSALLHSATMVVAGIWLLIQLSPIFNNHIQWFLIVIGATTLLVSNLLAIFSNHLKNTLAFSTMAQLGLMTVAVGLGNSEGALLHIVSHAFFKSGLFLICGVLMHQLNHSGFFEPDNQHFENFTGILKNNFLFKLPFLLCLAALAGVPFTSGFISKESIMPHIFSQACSLKEYVGFFVVQLGISGTAFYTTRIAIITCFKSGDENLIVSKNSLLFTVPVCLLSVGAGFWLFGFNPFSSQGWLVKILNVEGQYIMPDIIGLLVGCYLGFRFSKSDHWVELKFGTNLQQRFLNMYDQISAINFGWKGLLGTSRFVNNMDVKLIDKTLDNGSKVFVIGGHFANFVDRKLVDGLILGLVSVVKFIGEILLEQTRKAPQSAAFFILIVIFLILYFSV